MRPTRMLPARLAVLGMSCVLAAIVGCGDDSNPVIPGLQAKYLVPSTPLNVLENLKRAYTSRDSAGYDSLFDNAYAGISVDNNDPAPVLTFTKADESAHIGALARSTTITSVLLSFGPNVTRFTDSGDSVGWASVQAINPALVIIDDPNGFLSAPNNYMLFKFRPTTPAPASSTDTTWKIVRWSEVAN